MNTLFVTGWIHFVKGRHFRVQLKTKAHEKKMQKILNKVKKLLKEALV